MSMLDGSTESSLSKRQWIGHIEQELNEQKVRHRTNRSNIYNIPLLQPNKRME